MSNLVLNIHVFVIRIENVLQATAINKLMKT